MAPRHPPPQGVGPAGVPRADAWRALDSPSERDGQKHEQIPPQSNPISLSGAIHWFRKPRFKPGSPGPDPALSSCSARSRRESGSVQGAALQPGARGALGLESKCWEAQRQRREQPQGHSGGRQAACPRKEGRPGARVPRERRGGLAQGRRGLSHQAGVPCHRQARPPSRGIVRAAGVTAKPVSNSSTFYSEIPSRVSWESSLRGGNQKMKTAEEISFDG